MYTIGQVAQFLGISRDTLKYYEEKELIKPVHDDNGYRKYNPFDIHDVITTNFYRELDLGIKKIREIKESSSIETVEHILEEKEADILAELEYKKRLLKQIKAAKEECNKIKELLGTYTIKEMKPLEVIGEISDYKAYHEYEMIRRHTEGLKKAVTLKSVRRVIHFDENGIKDDRFIVVKQVEDTDDSLKGEVLAHPKCIYMVVENGRAVEGEKNIDNEIGERIVTIASQEGYELTGITYINILLTIYEDGFERVFLELYSPIT